MVFENGTGTQMIKGKTEQAFLVIYNRAHTFDGYAYAGSNERADDIARAARADWVENRCQGWGLEELRTALFYEARSIHFSGYPPSRRLYLYMRDLDRMVAERFTVPMDRTEEYRTRTLANEGAWPAPSSKLHYGAVVLDGYQSVLLRQPRGHFDGYVWTHPKGRAQPNEHPLGCALRVVASEGGFPSWSLPEVIGHVPGSFGGTSTGSQSCYYLMRSVSPPEVEELDQDTAAVRWFPMASAPAAIAESTNEAGKARDLAVLNAALVEYQQMTAPLAKDTKANQELLFSPADP